MKPSVKRVVETRREAREARGASMTRLMGGRKALTERARALVEIAQAQITTELCSEKDVAEFIDTVRFGSSKAVMDRTCLNIRAMIYKLMGQERLLIVEFAKQIGATSEEEARAAVQAYRSVEGADLLTAIERCVAFLEGALPMFEEHRPVVVQRLGGYIPVRADANG